MVGRQNPHSIQGYLPLWGSDPASFFLSQTLRPSGHLLWICDQGGQLSQQPQAVVSNLSKESIVVPRSLTLLSPPHFSGSILPLLNWFSLQTHWAPEVPLSYSSIWFFVYLIDLLTFHNKSCIYFFKKKFKQCKSTLCGKCKLSVMGVSTSPSPLCSLQYSSTSIIPGLQMGKLSHRNCFIQDHRLRSGLSKIQPKGAKSPIKLLN